MAENNRGERLLNIFIHLITHPKQKFSVSQMMMVLGVPERDRRNVQRDMQSLVDLPGKYVVCEGLGAHKVYGTGLSVLDKLVLPNFEEVMFWAMPSLAMACRTVFCLGGMFDSKSL